MPVTASAEPFRSANGTVGVLFIHGFTGSPASLRDWAERTAAAGYAVSLPRLPGHGTRWEELAVTSWEDWYACVDRELTWLHERCEQVFVAALSMGGALALRLAEHRSTDVAGLILVNPALTARRRGMAFTGLLKHIVTTVGAVANDATIEIDEGGYERTPVAAAHAMYRLWSDVRPYLDLVRCPLLIFRSAVDHVVPPNSVEIIVRQVSSLEITEHVLHYSYHVATMDHDADFIVATTLDFLTAQTDKPE